MTTSKINLSRNTRVFFTTNINPATGVLTDAASGFTAANTHELNVLDGYSFSQGTQQQIVSVSEAGSTPSRGQRAFNTQLDPVDWAISTYIRPCTLGSTITAQERVLWNALLGAGTLDASAGVTITVLARLTTAGATSAAATVTVPVINHTVNGVTGPLGVGDVFNINGIVNNPTWNGPVMITGAHTGTAYPVEYFEAPEVAAGLTGTGTPRAYTGQWGNSAGLGATRFSYASTLASNRNQLQRFALLFFVDNVIYCVDNCAMDQVSIDFGLDAITMGAWSGKGTILKELSVLTLAHISSNSTLASLYTSANTQYITNKLSTLTLESNIGGTQNTNGSLNFSYDIPITGGNLTISNNITYLVPANLGVVNNPINYFTGQRSITGNITAYLKTGTAAVNVGAKGDAGNLLNTLLAAANTTTEPKYRMSLEVGGKTSVNRLELEMPGVVLQIPSVNIADIVACTINFTAQSYDPAINANGPGTFDLSRTNELLVKYFAA